MVDMGTLTYVIPRPPTILPRRSTVRRVLYVLRGSFTRENIVFTFEFVMRTDLGVLSSFARARVWSSVLLPRHIHLGMSI